MTEENIPLHIVHHVTSPITQRLNHDHRLLSPCDITTPYVHRVS